MNETKQYIADHIRVWAWSGFYSQQDAGEMIGDILEDGVDEDMLRNLIATEFAKKRKAEASWPAKTD